MEFVENCFKRIFTIEQINGVVQCEISELKIFLVFSTRFWCLKYSFCIQRNINLPAVIILWDAAATLWTESAIKIYQIMYIIILHILWEKKTWAIPRASKCECLQKEQEQNPFEIIFLNAIRVLEKSKNVKKQGFVHVPFAFIENIDQIINFKCPKC